MSEQTPQTTGQPAGAIVTVKQQQQVVSGLLEKFRGSIAQALPKHITPDRMIRVALTAMTKQPDLLLCTSHSIISAVMTAGQLGLLPDSVLGECYFIPFNNTKANNKECQIIIGYRGLCALAMRSGQVKSVQARAVFLANGKTDAGEAGDLFDFELGLDERLKHVPSGLKDEKYITHFYAIVKFNNGGHVLNVMTREEVEKIRNESKNYKNSQYKSTTIWGKYFEEMGNKTVLRRLMKFVPLSPEIQQAIGVDEAAEYGKQNLAVELLNNEETPEDMAEAIDAEIVDDYNQEQREMQDEQVKQKDAKVEGAVNNLKTILYKKKAGEGNNPTQQ